MGLKWKKKKIISSCWLLILLYWCESMPANYSWTWHDVKGFWDIPWYLQIYPFLQWFKHAHNTAATNKPTTGQFNWLDLSLNKHFCSNRKSTGGKFREIIVTYLMKRTQYHLLVPWQQFSWARQMHHHMLKTADEVAVSTLEKVICLYLHNYNRSK